VTNPLAATVGAAAETDAELRVRQGQSVALPSLTPFDAVDGALANISGVTRHKLYENDTGSVDINGLPLTPFRPLSTAETQPRLLRQSGVKRAGRRNLRHHHYRCPGCMGKSTPDIVFSPG
jgi:hypothetical protein